MIDAIDSYGKTSFDRTAMIIEVDTASSLLRSEANMIKPAFRDAQAAPTMDGREGAFDEPCDSGRATKRIDQKVRGCLHDGCLRQSQIKRKRESAIMAVATFADRLLIPTMTPAEIRAELARRNMTIRDLAEATGIHENYLTKSLNMRSEKPRRLQASEHEAVKRALFDDDDAETAAPLRKIPLLGSVPAGKLQPAEQHSGRWHAVSDPETPPRAYALTVEGDSMDLVVPNGATLIIDPDDKDLWPDRHYVVMTEDGQTTFKEFQDNPARFVPVSSNDTHQDIRLGVDVVSILGSVFSYTLRTPPRRGGQARTGGSRRSQQDS